MDFGSQMFAKEMRQGMITLVAGLDHLVRDVVEYYSVRCLLPVKRHIFQAFDLSSRKVQGILNGNLLPHSDT